MKKTIIPSLRVLYSNQSNPRLFGLKKRYFISLAEIASFLAMTIVSSFVILTSAICYPSSIYALTSTSSANLVATFSAKLALATPSASPTVTSIEDKIKNLVKENLSATESDLNEKINQKTLVGYVGNIKTISTENIAIDSQGNLIQVTTSNKTNIIKSGTNIKQSSLAIADKVIVIGTLVKSDILQAKRIVVVTEDENPVITNTLVATISSVDMKKKTIGLMVNGTEVLYGLSKKSTIKITDIEVGQTLFAITKLYQGVSSLSRAKIL